MISHIFLCVNAFFKKISGSGILRIRCGCRLRLHPFFGGAAERHRRSPYTPERDNRNCRAVRGAAYRCPCPRACRAADGARAYFPAAALYFSIHMTRFRSNLSASGRYLRSPSMYPFHESGHSTSSVFSSIIEKYPSLSVAVKR